MRRSARPAQAAEVDRARPRPLRHHVGLHHLDLHGHRDLGSAVQPRLLLPRHREDDLARLPGRPVRHRRAARHRVLRFQPGRAQPRPPGAQEPLLRLAHRPGLGRPRADLLRRLHAVRLPRRADQHRPLPVRQGPPRQLVGVHLQRVRPGHEALRAHRERRARDDVHPAQHRRHHRLPGARHLLQAPAHLHRADQRAHQARAEGARPAGHHARTSRA